MGKVVKAIAVIAIAAAIAYFAPTLAPAFLSSALGAAAASAIVATTLTIATSMAFQAISASPADAPSGYRRGYRRQDVERFRWVEEPPAEPVQESLPPIEPRHWWWAFFWPGQRFTIQRIAGDCMNGSAMEGARWALVDRHAAIRLGDVFAFDLDDLWTAYRPEMALGFLWWRRWTAIGMVKRYLGTEPEWGRIIFDCSNPPTLCETGRNHVRYAYRARAASRRWIDCWRARRAIIADNAQFDTPLDADRPIAAAGS